MKILNKKKNLPEEKYPKEMLLNLYRTMVRIRSFEEHAAECFTKGMLAGNIHLSIGQEGAEAGAFAAIGPQDYFTSTHRGHGHAIARGADAKLAMAELFGKETGYCKGKGGSMHIADMKKMNHLGANGIVGKILRNRYLEAGKLNHQNSLQKAPVHIPAQELLIRRVYCVESLFMNLQRKSVGICKKCHRFSGKLIGTDRLCHNSEAV